jgi:hypothetical protein
MGLKLGLSQSEVFNCTPRKLYALIDAHITYIRLTRGDATAAMDEEEHNQTVFSELTKLV